MTKKMSFCRVFEFLYLDHTCQVGIVILAEGVPIIQWVFPFQRRLPVIDYWPSLVVLIKVMSFPISNARLRFHKGVDAALA
jgi:hypothetical protein